MVSNYLFEPVRGTSNFIGLKLNVNFTGKRPKMSVDEKLLLIRNYDLWSHLSDEEYEELNIVHNFIEAKNGDYVYFEAFHHHRLYFIKDGLIRVGYIDDNGNEVIKEIIQKGEIFGQITLEKSNLNGEFAQAYRSDVSLCSFSIEDFENLLKKKPELAIKYNKQIGSKLRQVESRLIGLLNKDVKTRFIDFLVKLYRSAEPTITTSGACIQNFLTHEDIAHLIGSSRQTVTTLINQLETEGWLEYTRQQICFKKVNDLIKNKDVV